MTATVTVVQATAASVARGFYVYRREMHKRPSPIVLVGMATWFLVAYA